MLDWKELVHLSDAELGQLDIAEVDLTCAAGLPGTENIDVSGCLSTLDRWADRVHCETNRIASRFKRSPERYENSWAYFRVLVMVTVLERDLGVRYNPARIADDAIFQTEDCFIHGVIQGEGGTCASLPVVNVAVGRRLGYPLKLVNAKRHLFARWDDGIERFNIESHGTGLNCPPDDYYRTGRYEAEPQYFEAGCWLQSMSPTEELANFVGKRAHCWLDNGYHRNAAHCFAWAKYIAPRNDLHLRCIEATLTRWRKKLIQLMPLPWPSIVIEYKRQYPERFIEFEREMVYLEFLEELSTRPEFQEAYREPIRRCPETGVPLRLPKKISIQHYPASIADRKEAICV